MVQKLADPRDPQELLAYRHYLHEHKKIHTLIHDSRCSGLHKGQELCTDGTSKLQNNSCGCYGALLLKRKQVEQPRVKKMQSCRNVLCSNRLDVLKCFLELFISHNPLHNFKQ